MGVTEQDPCPWGDQAYTATNPVQSDILINQRQRVTYEAAPTAPKQLVIKEGCLKNECPPGPGRWRQEDSGKRWPGCWRKKDPGVTMPWLAGELRGRGPEVRRVEEREGVRNNSRRSFTSEKTLKFGIQS